MADINKSARNERKKLLATTLNTLGLAFVVPGVILPLVTLLYGAEMRYCPSLKWGGSR